MDAELLTSLPSALLEVSLLLGGAVLVGLLTQRIHIPLTVILAIAGILVVEFGASLAVADLLTGRDSRSSSSTCFSRS
jgi:CPA1 family monovalent cation:H+ antiporter